MSLGPLKRGWEYVEGTRQVSLAFLRAATRHGKAGSHLPRGDVGGQEGQPAAEAEGVRHVAEVRRPPAKKHARGGVGGMAWVGETPTPHAVQTGGCPVPSPTSLHIFNTSSKRWGRALGHSSPPPTTSWVLGASLYTPAKGGLKIGCTSEMGRKFESQWHHSNPHIYRST